MSTSPKCPQHVSVVVHIMDDVALDIKIYLWECTEKALGYLPPPCRPKLFTEFGNLHTISIEQ